MVALTSVKEEWKVKEKSPAGNDACGTLVIIGFIVFSENPSDKQNCNYQSPWLNGILHKRPNKIATNDRIKSPQTTEKSSKDLYNSIIISIFAAKLSNIYDGRYGCRAVCLPTARRCVCGSHRLSERLRAKNQLLSCWLYTFDGTYWTFVMFDIS